MTTLVTGNSNTLNIFFYSCLNDFFYRPVMAQVNDLSTFTLHNSPHDIDGGIMTIKKTGCRNNTNLIGRVITHKL